MIFYENKKFYKFLAIIFLILNYLVFLFKPYYFVTFDSKSNLFTVYIIYTSYIKSGFYFSYKKCDV